VWGDRLFEVWARNPGVLAHAEAVESPDPAIRDFAASLASVFEIIDVREAPIGMIRNRSLPMNAPRQRQSLPSRIFPRSS
jgi:hypothetical protein